jgi:general secretion pathway protein J
MQWRQGPQINSLDWDGRVLRITRRGSAGPSDGMRVAAWARRNDAGGNWLRWQSPPLNSLGDWQTYWAQAQNWAQNAGDEDKKREVSYYCTWKNGKFFTSGVEPGAIRCPATGPPMKPSRRLPDGVRAVLTLPPGQAIAGRLTLDWARPTVGGGKS